MPKVRTPPCGSRHPCRLANTSPCRACRELPPPSKCALPGAQKKNLRKRRSYTCFEQWQEDRDSPPVTGGNIEQLLGPNRSLLRRWSSKCGIILEHAHPVEWLECTLVAGTAKSLWKIPCRSLTSRHVRIKRSQRIDVVVVDVPNHADAVPRGHALGRAPTP